MHFNTLSRFFGARTAAKNFSRYVSGKFRAQ